MLRFVFCWAREEDICEVTLWDGARLLSSALTSLELDWNFPLSTTQSLLHAIGEPLETLRPKIPSVGGLISRSLATYCPNLKQVQVVGCGAFGVADGFTLQDHRIVRISVPPWGLNF